MSGFRCFKNMNLVMIKTINKLICVFIEYMKCYINFVPKSPILFEDLLKRCNINFVLITK